MSIRPSGPARIGRIGDWSNSGNGGNNNRGGGPRIASLRDLASGGGPPPSLGGGGGPTPDDDSDDEGDRQEGESWFAGGERSGISVQNPDAGRPPPGGDAVRRVLRRAAQDAQNRPSDEPQSSVFSGGGHTLGSDEVESQYIPDPNAPAAGQELVTRDITFWQDGFSIEDGELLPYDNPENARILQELQAGRAPPHLLNVSPDQPVDLRIAQRTHEKYVPPKKAAFQGSGSRLGAPIPSEGSSSIAEPVASSNTSTPTSSQPASITTRFEVDASKPTTSVQLRLADGTRMVARMNHDHTVGDLRNFINASRPENLSRPYTVGTTFPNRTLEDDKVTIKDAGLINSVVVQRWA